MNRELLQQALHHLVELADDLRRIPSDIAQTIAALEAELAKPEQAPVAQIRIKNGYWIDTPQSQVNHLPDGLHDLYTAPPRKEWVGLTDDDVSWADGHSHGNTTWTKQKAFARALEKRLKEANNA